MLNRVPLCGTPWAIAHQAPLTMGFSRQEYWRGLPFPSPGDLPNPRIEPTSLMSPALAGRFFTTEREARRGSQGASRAAPGKSGLPARSEEERVVALE